MDETAEQTTKGKSEAKADTTKTAPIEPESKSGEPAVHEYMITPDQRDDFVKWLHAQYYQSEYPGAGNW